MAPSKATQSEDSDVWLTLLDWLDSKGFDRSTLKVDLRTSDVAGGGRKLVATEDIHPNQLLIRLPKKSLLNYATLAPLYPIPLHSSLTANQLICLHICLYRHAEYKPAFKGETEIPETFVPYIRSLPQDFDTIPLWREVLHDETWSRICSLDLQPEGLKKNTEDVSRRFHGDWRKTSEVWSAHLPTSLPGLESFEQYTVENYLWAWLCVNSRVIWYDLGLPSKDDNVTLAAVVDGNHLPKTLVQILHDDLGRLELVSSSAASSPFVKAPPNNSILTRVGEEIFYTYGNHSDHTLLAEYGFAFGAPVNSDNNVDITKRVQRLFEELPAKEKQKKQELLEEHQYWGDYHLQLDADGKADVSYRLTIALSLLNLPFDNDLPGRPSKRAKVATHGQAGRDVDDAAVFAPFLALINGEIDTISPENEQACRVSLSQICKELEKDAIAAIDKLEKDFAKEDGVVQMLIVLWQVELWFALELK